MAENCPFCMTMINEGATVCASCGATKTMTNPAWVGLTVILILPAASVAVGVFANSFWVGLIAFFGLFFAFGKLITPICVWVRRRG